MDELIKAVNITKSYGGKKILENVNLSIEAGTAICLFAHNGSGKSTLLKIIAGVLKPSSGNMIYHEKLKMAYVPDRFPKLEITVHDFIIHMGLIEGKPKDILIEKSHELYDRFFITSMKETKLKDLSKGSLQKVAVIQALLTQADVVLMDEPISGQDLDSQNSFIQIMNDLKQNGTAVVMCCHEQVLVDYIADQTYEINNGILLKRQYQYDLQAEYAVIELLSLNKSMRSLEEIRHLLVEVIQKDGRTRIKVKKQYSDAVIMFLLKKEWTLVQMNMEVNKHEIHI